MGFLPSPIGMRPMAMKMTALCNTQRTRRHLRICIAQADTSDGESSQDWDESWKQFKASKRVNRARRGQSPPSRVSSPAKKKTVWNSGPQTDEIRKIEQGLLSSWTQESFFAIGAVVAILVLGGILLLAGPPPSDSRCTLPWC